MAFNFFGGYMSKHRKIYYGLNNNQVTDFFWFVCSFARVPNKWMYFFNDIVLTYPFT